MKNVEALNKAFRVFQGDEDDALLRLAKLKERADYRKYFAENIGKVKAAYPRDKSGTTIRVFYDGMLRRFGILPSSYACRPIEEWASFFDPLTDAREAPETVRREILPWLFYWPGVREVVSLTRPDSVVTVIRGKGECPRIVEDAECEPYERLYKIDLWKKPAQLFGEFKAALAAVDARRGLDPAEYTAWKQDRTRKRAEEWDHLEVWRLRRQVPKPTFPEIAKRLRITPAAAKKSFYRAYELIYGTPFDLEAWKKERAGNPFQTCANCPQRQGCTEPCPEIFEEKTSTREYLTENIAESGDSHSYSEWLTLTCHSPAFFAFASCSANS
jgi:hypothetical protein